MTADLAGASDTVEIVMDALLTKADISVVAGARDLAVLVDDNVLPLVLASVPGVLKRGSVWAPLSTEVVTVALVTTVTGGVVFMLVEVTEAA